MKHDLCLIYLKKDQKFIILIKKFLNIGKIGKLGEDIAVMFLKKHEFDVFTRNYQKITGEIDIIAKKYEITHFIEVKSVSREIINGKAKKGDFIEPEENIHKDKLLRIYKTILIFIKENYVSRENWQFDVCIVYIDKKSKKSIVKFMEDVIIDIY